jgi:outer membrane murein-binding lipoprotein Lpp
VLQKRVLHVAGVATREQVSRLSRELDKLGKKVEKLAKKRSKHGEQSAAQQ